MGDLPVNYKPDLTKSEVQNLELTYRKKVKELLKLTDIKEINKFYDEEVFPLSMVRFYYEYYLNTEVVDYLYLPVGLQVNSPILSVLASPAKHIVFIASTESKKVCREVAKILKIKKDNYSILSFRKEPYFDEIIETVASHFFLRKKSRTTFVFDITSGKKTMSIAIASIAITYDMPMVYIESTNVKKMYKGINEVKTYLPSVKLLFEKLEKGE